MEVRAAECGRWADLSEEAEGPRKGGDSGTKQYVSTACCPFSPDKLHSTSLQLLQDLVSLITLYFFSFTLSICFSTWALKFAQGPPVLEDHPITLLQAPAQLGTISLYQVNFIHPLLTFYPNLASSPLTPAASTSPRCFLVLEGLKTRQREGSMKCIGHCE